MTDLRPSRSAQPLIIDATIALGLTALSLFALAAGSEDIGGRDPLSVVLLVTQSLPLVVRRRWPLAVLAVTGAATVAHVWLAGPGGVNEGLGSLVALYTVAERYDRRTSVPAAAALAAAFGGIIAIKGGLPGAMQGLFQTEVIVLIAWALGDWGRTRRRYAAAVEDRARLLEHERSERERRAVQDERERIARELHDIVTHHVSVIVIQAGAALTAMDRRPEHARAALQAIDHTGREALTDMRRMLGILGSGRPDTAGPGGVAAGQDAREPMPGLERLGELLEQVRAAGLPVELTISGDRRPLDAGVELSAYRIIQEALTNALKHARGAHARVELRYDPAAVLITVQDEGATGRHDLGETASGGRGLIGMRERAALYGGELSAGPTPTGFRVAARLPVDARPLAPAPGAGATA